MSDERDYEYDEPDEEIDPADNCGSRGHRQCDLAGTEWCDWSCPLHDEVFPPKKGRK